MALASTCAGGGKAGTVVTAALHFYAAAQCLLQEPWPAQASICNGTCFDFIVVGGGTAGAALAPLLAALPGATVLLLEAGGDPPLDAVPGFRGMLKGSTYDWKFQTVNDLYYRQALIGGSQKQPRGKMLGGSGSLNDMVYARGFPADYEHWATIADDSWNWTNVLEYFKKSEHLTDERIVKEPALLVNHGFGGPIQVSGLVESTFDIDKFLDAFKELGFKMVKDMTSTDEIGVGRFSHTIKQGRRFSSLTGILNKAAAKSNLRVLKNAIVASVLITNNTAYGVRVLKNNKELHFYANKEVILSAGTFNTPKILLLSGIGPKEHLQSFKIRVVQDLPGVGDNLQDHVMVLNFLTADNGTCYTDEAAKYMNVIRYLHDRSGPLAVSNSMGAYSSSDSSRPNVPDFAFYPTCSPVNAGFKDECTSVLGFNDDICSKLAALNEHRELVVVAAVLLEPKSRDKVRLRSTDPLVDPLIYSGTFENPEDLERFPAAIRRVRALAGTTHLRSKRAQFVELDVAECGELAEAPRARCGAQAALGAVLDARLRVADASVMPAVVRANTNAPVVMMASRPPPSSARITRGDLRASVVVGYTVLLSYMLLLIFFVRL